MKKAQRVGAPGQQAQQQIVSGSSRRAAPGFAAASGHGARQRRLLFVKSEAFGDNRVLAALDARDEAFPYHARKQARMPDIRNIARGHCHINGTEA